MSFSALMSIYHRTLADELNATLTSIANQTLLPSEMVVVFDGPVSSSVEQEINNFSHVLPTVIVPMPVNRGLGIALREGLLRCACKFVARVDSDDRSIHDRFSLQYEFINANPSVSVVGGAMREWHWSTESKTSTVRTCPIFDENERHLIRWRNPLNHPTVLFNKAHVLNVGNYKEAAYFEDYHLWARLILRGHWITSLPDVLVETDVNPDFYYRRGGFSYLKHEHNFAMQMRLLGYFTLLDHFVFLLSRTGVRLLPNVSREYFYKKILR